MQKHLNKASEASEAKRSSFPIGAGRSPVASNAQLHCGVVGVEYLGVSTSPSVDGDSIWRFFPRTLPGRMRVRGIRAASLR